MRTLFFLIAGFLCYSVASAAGDSLLFGINEGVAVQGSPSEMQAKYQELSNVISQALKKEVHVEATQDLKSLAENLKKGRYDLIYARPSNLTAKALRDNNYVLVASAKNELTVAFIVNKDAPLLKPEDMLGKRIAMAEEKSLASKVGYATLRDMGVDPAKQKIHYARLQEAVAFMVEKNFADVGIIGNVGVKDWEKKGGRILFRSKKFPSWAVIAPAKTSPADIAKIRAALVNLDTSEAGQKILAKTGIKGFTAGDSQEYVDFLKWIGA